MKSIYTTSVSNVPSNYNDPTPAYKKHVWIAVAGIFAFFAFYLFLTYWFFASAYRLLFDAFGGGNSNLVTVGVGIAALFLGIFMIKSFFFVQTKYEVQDRLINPEEEPVLFDYLHKLADEIGAPRPSKVYLSNRVNASVFYDLSFLNLFFPSKKNLEIGLGLINVLNLGEFKAVLAHEYGHFAQKSMLVGRWVYIANQIANSIITRRDALDSLLNGLSRFDLRVAWIGWILSIIVWSIRSLVELIFRIVVLSQRALSREMEFQADLVAVSVTGSDALIHALHKLQAADAALSDAMSSVGDQLGAGKAVEDLYAIQSNSIEKTAYILNDEEYGKSPKIDKANPESHKVFSDKIAQPPKMWLTHPPDQEREANAKRSYISGEIDDRSAWDLFSNPSEIKIEMTKELINGANIETELLPTNEALISHNRQFEKSYFNPDYRGVYLKRFFCQEYERSSDIYISDMSLINAANKVDKLYPETLVEELEDFTTLQEEFVQLKAINDKKLTASGDNGIWHRGTQIRRKELLSVIRAVKSEVDVAQKKVADHDRLVRTTHLKLAESLGGGWKFYLEGLLSVIHFAEHNIANINDAHRSLGHVLSVVMADNNVSSSELRTLIYECNDVHGAIASVSSNQNHLTLDSSLRAELNIKEGDSLFEEFKFPPANESNIDSWLKNVEGWIGSYVSSLDKLRSEALELLLVSERKVLEMYRTKERAAAPAPSKIDVKYNLLQPGNERTLDMKLSLWDKFISADGIVPAITKFAVAASIVGSTAYYAGYSGMSDLSIYNGLGQTVVVNLDGNKVKVKPQSYKKTDFSTSGNYDIKTTTLDGQAIEIFSPELSKASSHYVYNVARAGALYEYRVYYGGNQGDHNRIIGSPRWSRTYADYIFNQPPQEIRTSSSGTTKDVLEAMSNPNALNVFAMLEDTDHMDEFIKSHILWDPSNVQDVIQWLSVASSREDAGELLKQRLEKYPDEVESLRILMDDNDNDRKTICDKYISKAKADPNNPDFHYIATRCMSQEADKIDKFIEGAEKWPDHGWINYAASHSYFQRGDLQSAYDVLLNAYENSNGLKPVIGLNAERVKSYAEVNGVALNEVIPLESYYLDHYKSLERGDKKEPYVHIHYLINQGLLEEAMKMAKGIDDMRLSTTAICAASDGGKQSWVEAAITFSPDSLSDLALLSVVGLRLRNNMSINNLMEILDRNHGSKYFSVADFIEKIKARNFKAAEILLSDTGYATEAQMYVLAYVAYGNRVPEHWKMRANALLFASEKPYIK